MSMMESEDFDFEAAMAAKLTGEEPEETEPEETGDEPDEEPDSIELDDDEPESEDVVESARARDEKGRFVPKEPETPGQDAAEELILGKFKSQDDLLKAYQELESRDGSRNQELGELRKAVDELRSSFEDDDDEPEYAPIDQGTLDTIDEMTEQQPQQAALWALENQPRLLPRILRSWHETDSFGATVFQNALAQKQQQDAFKAELEKFREELNPQLKPLQQQARTAEFQSAWGKVSEKYADMRQFAPAMQEAAQKTPELAQALMSGDSASKERLIENLYFLAKGMQADTIHEAARDLARKDNETNRAAKTEATVASASSSAARGEKSKAQKFKEELLATPLTSIEAGLTFE